MIAPDLLRILVCPETHQRLTPADAALVDSLNGRIAAGEGTNRGGRKVTERIDSGLLREDGKLIYPIRNDLPILLIDEGIPLA